MQCIFSSLAVLKIKMEIKKKKKIENIELVRNYNNQYYFVWLEKKDHNQNRFDSGELTWS